MSPGMYFPLGLGRERLGPRETCCFGAVVEDCRNGMEKLNEALITSPVKRLRGVGKRQRQL